MRQPRGFKCSIKRLIAPPFPAASRPSISIRTFKPLALTSFEISKAQFANSLNLFHASIVLFFLLTET